MQNSVKYTSWHALASCSSAIYCVYNVCLSERKNGFFWRMFKGVLLLSWEIHLGATWSEMMSRCHHVPCSMVPKAMVKGSRLQCFARMGYIFHSYWRPDLGLLLSQTLLQTFRHSLCFLSQQWMQKKVSSFNFIYDNLVLLQSSSDFMPLSLPIIVYLGFDYICKYMYMYICIYLSRLLML